MRLPWVIKPFVGDNHDVVMVSRGLTFLGEIVPQILLVVVLNVHPLIKIYNFEGITLSPDHIPDVLLLEDWMVTDDDMGMGIPVFLGGLGSFGTVYLIINLLAADWLYSRKKQRAYGFTPKPLILMG